MATTPPPAVRIRTPPTPLHGPHHDSYEPYSPRRSKRSTAHSNPYSSLNTDRSPRHLTTPPTTAKKARFSRAPPQLSSPPSSPASPIKRRTLHKTPRRQKTNGAPSDSDASAHSHAPSTIDPITMLPTPSKTPKKRAATALTARVLSFQPISPGDVMPSSRKIKEHVRRHPASEAGFELYDSDSAAGGGHQIAIYTDPNARVPEMDESEENPFIGPRRTAARPQHRQSRKSGIEQHRDQRMKDAVKRGEGLTYVFRGRTIFRKFEDDNGDEGDSADQNDLGSVLEQKRLKHSAGASASRPLTRSAIKPRLLFPSAEERAQHERREEEVDEEAVTDIEMSNAPSPISASMDDEDGVGDVKARHTHRAKRKHGNEHPATTLPRPGLDEMSAVKSQKAFESWPRTKPGLGKRRAKEGSETEASSVKRAKGLSVEGSK